MTRPSAVRIWSYSMAALIRLDTTTASTRGTIGSRRPGQRRGEVLFPTENSSWPSRYSQYTVIRPISADHDSKTVWAETFLGIQVQGAPEGEPWNDRYLIFLENYSPDDLYAIRELVHRSGGHSPHPGGRARRSETPFFPGGYHHHRG